MQNRAIKYRIYPNASQCELLAKTFGCCRKVWNLMLADRKNAWDERKESLHPTPARYKEEYPYLKEVDSLALANVQLALNQAYKNFFESCKKKGGKKIGYPNFKSKRRSKRSYSTNNQSGTIRIDGDLIHLPKIGDVKAMIHRQPKDGWKLKSATVSQASDGSYYCSILFEMEECIPTVGIDLSRAIGLDYKSNGLYTDSDGHVASHHKFYQESEKKLAKEQRKLSRKVGSKKKEIRSNNYWKQQKRVDRIHRHIANQRIDFLHKLSTEIANQYDIVCVEDLDMKAMSNKGFGNGKATMDNGYGMFLNMLDYKLKERGKQLVKIDKWFASSQICHQCGTVHPEMKNLSLRTMDCDCGCHCDRDMNAAINIKNEGLRLIGSI